MDQSRRRSDGAAGTGAKGQPVMQTVVGFKVEGAKPSPENVGFLSTDGVPGLGASSPTPVIIPPTLQTSSARSAAVEAAASKAVMEIIAPNTSVPVPATVIPLASLQEASSSQSGAALPSAPKAILQPERSEASHAGLSRAVTAESVPNSDTISVASGVSTNMFSRSDGPASVGGAGTGNAPAKTHQHQQHHHQHASGHQAHSVTGKSAAGGPPSVSGAEKDKPKSQKEMTKAERRALQEAQRAAKAASQTQGSKPTPKKEAPAAPAGAKDSGRPGTAGGAADKKTDGGRAARGSDGHSLTPAAASADAGQASAVVKVKKQQGAKVVSLNPTELFAHLQQFKKVSVQTLLRNRDVGSMHPAVLQLGMKYADGTITGATARCTAMLHTFCQVIQDYTTPEGKSLSRDLTQQLNAIINFLVECRPLAVSMGNAIKTIKLKVSQIDPSTPEADAKAYLIGEIQEYIRQRIGQAEKWLPSIAITKIVDGDVLMVFAYSHIVACSLLEAKRQGRNFKVVVVDARPELEGLYMLKKLQAAGIPCTYAHFNALSFVIRDVSKVFLGASAVMSNGTVMGRAGNAAVAMMAHAHSKPVLLCCETFKFHERVQLDAITHNELGDPDALTTVAGRPEVNTLQGWRETPRLGLLNLKYDAMPAEFVTAIVTEHAMIPPTSVPVILREYQQYAGEHPNHGL